jgi:acetyl esterase/lipase
VVSTNPSGVATFGDLQITGAPGDRTLRFSMGSLGDESDPIALAYGEGSEMNLQYCNSGGVSQKMDVYIPDNLWDRPRPIAVYVHGGGWTSGSKDEGGLLWPELKAELLSRGYIVATLNYRLAPTWKWPAQIHDVKCAIRHFRAEADDYGLDPGRMGVWGASSGGHLAAMLGVTDASSGLEGDPGYQYQGWSSRVAAAVPIGGISDLTPPAGTTELTFSGRAETFATWPGPSQELTDASPITWASADDPPFLIVHGEEDGSPPSGGSNGDVAVCHQRRAQPGGGPPRDVHHSDISRGH